MLILLLLLLAAFPAFAQNPNTAVFPTGVAADADLLVASNRAQSTLASSIDNATLSITLTDASGFTTPFVLTLESERIKVCSAVGNVLTVCSGGRGFDGSSAAAHTAGVPAYGNLAAHHFNQLAAEIKAIETALGASLGNVAGITHASRHKHGGADEVATATPGSNAIPKAGAGSTLADGWIAASNVTQHQAALSVTESQISDLTHRGAGNGLSLSGNDLLVNLGFNFTWTGYHNLSGATFRPPETVFSGLPSAAANTGKIYVVTDASAVGVCTSGSGSARALCRSNGSTWESLGDGGAGGTAHNLLSATHTDTAAASVVLGDLLYGNGTPAWQRLPGNTTAAKQYLSQTGNGSISATPAWSAILAADLPTAIDAVKIADGSISNAEFQSLDGVAADFTSASGAAQVSTARTETGATTRTVESKVREYVTAEDFGAVGDGSTDDTAALQNALDAVCGTRKTLVLGASYKTTASLTVTTSPCRITGGGSLLPTSSSGQIHVLDIDGSNGAITGSATTISPANAAINATEAIDFDSVSGFSVGDYVSLSFNNGTQTYAQVSRIASIVSNTVTFEDPVLIPIDAAASNTVVERVMLEDIHISDLTFDGSGCTGTAECRGIEANRIANSTFKNLRFLGLKNNSSAGFVVQGAAYGLFVEDIWLNDSGDSGGGTTSDLWFINVSNSTIRGVRSTNASGFGPQFSQNTNVNIENLTSISSAARGLKMSGCAWIHSSNIVSSMHAFNGIAITNGTYRLFMVNAEAHQNNSVGGVWLSNHEDDYNTFVNLRAFDNDTADIVVAGSTDSDNLFYNAAVDAVSDSGTRTVIWRRANASSKFLITGTQFDRITTDVIETARTNSTLVNGNNHDVATPTSFIRISGPSATFNITGLASPVDGKIVTLYNTTAFDMVLLHNDTGSSPGNRLELAKAGSSVTITGTGSATFIYDAQTAIWRLVSSEL